MADVVHRPVSAQILNKNRGQRVQILTFSGQTYINTRWGINGTNAADSCGVPTLARIKSQELSNGFLPARDEDDPTTNGHFTVTVE